MSLQIGKSSTGRLYGHIPDILIIEYIHELIMLIKPERIEPMFTPQATCTVYTCYRCVHLPVMLSMASWLKRVLAVLVATQRKTPASTCLTPVTCRIPMGSRVYLDREERVDTGEPQSSQIH